MSEFLGLLWHPRASNSVDLLPDSIAETPGSLPLDLYVIFRTAEYRLSRLYVGLAKLNVGSERFKNVFFFQIFLFAFPYSSCECSYSFRIYLVYDDRTLNHDRLKKVRAIEQY